MTARRLTAAVDGTMGELRPGISRPHKWDKVMGFGHRVYKNGDSRVPTMKAAPAHVAAAHGGQRWNRCL